MAKYKSKDKMLNLVLSLVDKDNPRSYATVVHYNSNNKTLVSTDGHSLISVKKTLLPLEQSMTLDPEVLAAGGYKETSVKFPNYTGILPDLKPYKNYSLTLPSWFSKLVNLPSKDESYVFLLIRDDKLIISLDKQGFGLCVNIKYLALFAGQTVKVWLSDDKEANIVLTEENEDTKVYDNMGWYAMMCPVVEAK